MSKIQLNKPTAFTGRNGTFATQGIQITEAVDTRIIIKPLKKDGEPANCMMSINKEDIQTFIDALNKFR